MNLSIVICTYQRAEILEECLASLATQTVGSEFFELLVIDNNSTDKTKEVAWKWKKKFHNFRYYFESRPGLSNARNRGFMEASGKWVGYIDDDARVFPNFIERALWVIETYAFDAFGGIFYSWFRNGKPKWLPSDFEQKKKLRDSIGEIQEGFISGGVSFFKKKILEELGGFSLDLGMQQKAGYGEEDELQIRMREKGYRIGFDPELIIEHCVMPHKLQLYWHFNAAYAKGRDSCRIFGKKKFNFFSISKEIVYTLGLRVPRSIFRFLIKRDYYWQNAVLEVGIPFALIFGALSAFKKNATPSDKPPRSSSPQPFH